MQTQVSAIGPYQPFLPPEIQAADTNQTNVEDGRNFAWTSDSVFSAYGHELGQIVSTLSILPKTVCIADQRYIASGAGVYRIEADGSYTEMQLGTAHANTTNYDLFQYRWSYAYVGTSHWFCHPLTNELIYYDQHADQWGLFRDPCWEGPLFGITHADNSLVLLMADVIVWSQFDEGTSFSCDWTKGTGAQSLALIRYGQPYAIMPYNGAALTFTSKGVMLTRPDYNPVPAPSDNQQLTNIRFRHEEMTFDRLPLGPAAITHADERGVYWLSKRGLYLFGASQGGGFGAVQATQPGFSLFYKDHLIPVLARPEEASLEYVADLGWLFVSTAREAQMGRYDQAHVLQVDLERWGSFDHAHIHVGYGPQDFRMSFWDEQGRERRVDHRPENSPSWVKFTALQLRSPQEGVNTEMVPSVQQVRISRGKPLAQPQPKANIQSTWDDQARTSLPTTQFDVVVAAGIDSKSYIFDEQEYAFPYLRGEEISVYNCSVTGPVINVVAIALGEDQAYKIKTIEAAFFFAGVL